MDWQHCHWSKLSTVVSIRDSLLNSECANHDILRHFTDNKHTTAYSVGLWLCSSCISVLHDYNIVMKVKPNRKLHLLPARSQHLLFKKVMAFWLFTTEELQWRKSNATKILLLSDSCTAFHCFTLLWLFFPLAWNLLHRSKCWARIFSKQFIRMLCLDCNKNQCITASFLHYSQTLDPVFFFPQVKDRVWRPHLQNLRVFSHVSLCALHLVCW